jgi:hypothetical protein
MQAIWDRVISHDLTTILSRDTKAPVVTEKGTTDD